MILKKITFLILLSFIIRVIIGVLQPKKSGLVDISFGGVLGIIRGYIIFVLIISASSFSIANGTLFTNPKLVKDAIAKAAKTVQLGLRSPQGIAK